MKHIVYTIGSLDNPGGVERVLVNKANFLVQKYKVTILVAQKNKSDFAYSISPSVNILVLDINKYDNGWTKIPILGFFYKIKKLKKIYQNIMNQIKPDIVINVERGFEDFILPKLNPHIPCIRESHSSLQASGLMDHYNKSIKGKFFTYLYNQQLKKFDKLVLLTEEDRKFRNYKNGDVVIPNVVSKFDIEPNYDLNAKEVISVGRLDQFKNFKDQILVWKNIIKTHPNWKLKIYGEGPEKKSLSSLIKTLELESHVFLMGRSNHIEKELKNSAFFLFTSMAEGFGMVLVEAMQMGLPVISYNCPCGPKDIITDNEDGFLVRLNDRDELQLKILELIEKLHLRKTMSSYAIEKSKRYNEGAIMPRWIELFDKIINKYG